MSRIIHWIVLATTVLALLVQILGRYPMPRQLARLMWLIWAFLLLNSLHGLFVPTDSLLELPIAILLFALGTVGLVMVIRLFRKRAIGSE